MQPLMLLSDHFAYTSNKALLLEKINHFLFFFFFFLSVFFLWINTALLGLSHESIPHPHNCYVFIS